jgi:hypothetical protein
VPAGFGAEVKQLNLEHQPKNEAKQPNQEEDNSKPALSLRRGCGTRKGNT